MQTNKTKVLVVEDEASIRKFISINLHRADFEVLEAGDGETALRMAEKSCPDVIVLDVMLPAMDGFEVCMQIRRLMPQVVIIMLTARGEDMDKIMGLELGADDYMVKPFNPLELVARIRANLRKLASYPFAKARCIFFRELKLDLEGSVSQKWRRNRADAYGICHHEIAHEQPQESLQPQRNHEQCLGAELFWGSENRRCPYPQNTGKTGRRPLIPGG